MLGAAFASPQPRRSQTLPSVHKKHPRPRSRGCQITVEIITAGLGSSSPPGWARGARGTPEPPGCCWGERWASSLGRIRGSLDVDPPTPNSLQSCSSLLRDGAGKSLSLHRVLRPKGTTCSWMTKSSIAQSRLSIPGDRAPCHRLYLRECCCFKASPSKVVVSCSFLFLFFFFFHI